jgi:hypothetical protein
MKTAMQELEEKLKDNLKWIVMNADYELMDKLFIQGLEKEKEQIEDAWDAGMSEGIGTTMADLDWDGEFVNYYKETYGE